MAPSHYGMVYHVYRHVSARQTFTSSTGLNNTYLLIYLIHGEKLTGSQIVKEFSIFCGTRGFITALQVPANCPYLEPDQSSLCPSHSTF